jgi:hypothetical protein
MLRAGKKLGIYFESILNLFLDKRLYSWQLEDLCSATLYRQGGYYTLLSRVATGHLLRAGGLIGN